MPKQKENIVEEPQVDTFDTPDTFDNSKKYRIIILAIIIFLGVIGLITVWYIGALPNFSSKNQENQGRLEPTSRLLIDEQQVPQDIDYPDDPELRSWPVYENTDLGIKFRYPEGWIVREEIDAYNNRIYIESQDSRNYNAGNLPSEDYLGMYIEYIKLPEDNEQYFQNKLGFYDSPQVENKTVTIYTHESEYNPDSERRGVGPFLTAIWHDNNWLYQAETLDSDFKETNEKNVNFCKKILSTVVIGDEVTDINLPQRIVYRTTDSGEAFSVDINGKNRINLSEGGVPAVKYLGIDHNLVSGDGRILYFLKDNDVWSINTDGTKLVAITKDDLNYNDCVSKELDLVNSDGSLLVFSYNIEDGMGYEKCETRPEIHGKYLYNAITKKLKFVPSSRFYLIAEDEYQGNYDMMNFADNKLIFAKRYFDNNVSESQQDCNGCLYKLDFDNGDFVKFSDISFEGWLDSSSFINISNNRVIHDPNYDEYSQIIAKSYLDGNMQYLSPAGSFAQYQLERVSPSGRKLVYYVNNRNSTNNIYYLYDFTLGKATKLVDFNGCGIISWLGDQAILFINGCPDFYNQGEETKDIKILDLTTLQTKTFVENVGELVPSGYYY